MSSVWWEAAGFLISLAAAVGFQLYVRARLRADPLYTVQAVNHVARAAWVHDMVASRRDIVAVQTLRNSMMTATFLASTSVLLIMGVLTLSVQGAQFDRIWHALNMFGPPERGVTAAKLLFLLLDFFIAFFCFSTAIRWFSHVGYMINIPPDHPGAVPPAHIADYLNRAGWYFSVGMRAYYYAVPLVFWLFGPHFLVGATVVILLVVARLDRATRGMADDYRGRV